MSGQDERQEQIQKLWSLIKDIRFGMLTTVDEHGTLRSRPMAPRRSSSMATCGSLPTRAQLKRTRCATTNR